MEFLKKVADDRKIKLLEDRLGSGQSFEPLTIQKNVSIPTTTTTALTSVGITSSVTANVVTTATNGNTVTSASDNSAMNIVNPSTELHSEIVPLSDNMISSTNSNSDDNHNHSHNSINSNSNSYPSTVHSSAVDKIATNNENNEINENNENHSIRVINESSNASLVGVPLFDNSNTERDSRSCYSIDGEVSNEGKRKSSGSDKDREKSPKQKKAEVLENLSPENQENNSRGMRVRTIQSYFAPSIGNSNSEGPSLFSSATTASAATTTVNAANNSGQSVTVTAKAASSSTDRASSKTNSNANTQTIATLQSTIQDLKKQLEVSKNGREQLENKLQRTELDLKSYQDTVKIAEEKNIKMAKMIEDLHRRMAFQDFRRRRDRLAADCVRLGKIVTVRTGPTSVGDVWEEGYGLKELSKRSAQLLERKEELEARKKRVISLKRQAKRAATTADDSTSGINVSAEQEVEMDLDLATEMEAIKSHLEQLRRDETALAEERRLLESEKAVHQKELKRCQCEERSRFYKELPTLNSRYLLLSMLGRGGFSEVWKAFDLLELREVAVKIHQLNPTWTEERKSSYIKHVTREYTIHRDMKHPRVVQLFDVFEIDVNSFATVLEYCKGIDLDEKLKRQRIIPEKDARTIFMQILSGLRYLNKPLSYNTEENKSSESSSNGRKISIIHFDLKPANILFDKNGDVKITDFGLSKIIDETNEGTSLELTSQGAGTYWYLPPECFAKGSQPPRISSKVDVWSAGVIFYQMLYGTRPYGEGKTQEHLWSENVIFNASQVEFPSDPKSPKVSDEAKDLIRACLTRDQKYRPDVHAICQHSYLRNK